METAKTIVARPAEMPDAPGQIVTMGARERGADGSGRDAVAKRDWSAALNLINECFDAVRIAEERAAAAESHNAQLAQRLDEQARTFEARIAAANRRIDAAEARSRESDDWLIRFHDTIMDGFQKTFVK